MRQYLLAVEGQLRVRPGSADQRTPGLRKDSGEYIGTGKVRIGLGEYLGTIPKVGLTVASAIPLDSVGYYAGHKVAPADPTRMSKVPFWSNLGSSSSKTNISFGLEPLR